MDTNIHHLPEPMKMLGERIDAAYARAQRGTQEWIEGSLELIKAMTEARDRFNSDNAFGAWLGENGHDHVNKDDRAALINLGRDLILARTVLVETLRISYQRIWIEVKDRYLHAKKPTETSIPLSIVTETPAPEPVEVTIATPSEPEKATTRPTKITSHHTFHGLPRGDEIAAAMNRDLPSRLRELFKTRAKKDAWSLILQAYDAGFLTVGYSPGSNHITLRVLFPAAPNLYTKRFSFADKKDRDYMRNTILPAALAYREEVIAAPERLEEIVKRYEQEQRQQAVVKVQEERLAVARQKVSPLETDVVLYGKRFWPIIDITDPDQKYDYRQLQAAAFLFAETRNIVNDVDPKACGMKIRFMIKPLVTFNRGEDVHSKERERMRRVLALVTEMTRLMEDKGYSATVGDIMPMRPHEEG